MITIEVMVAGYYRISEYGLRIADVDSRQSAELIKTHIEKLQSRIVDLEKTVDALRLGKNANDMDDLHTVSDIKQAIEKEDLLCTVEYISEWDRYDIEITDGEMGHDNTYIMTDDLSASEFGTMIAQQFKQDVIKRKQSRRKS